MAIHLISLHQLVLRRPAAVVAGSAGPTPLNPVPVSEAAATPIHVAEPPCGLSAGGVATLVDQCGENAGRALLGLLYRISALESEVAELRLELGRRAPAIRTRRKVDAPPTSPRSGKKHNLLEQIFRNNLLLWNSMDTEP